MPTIPYSYENEAGETQEVALPASWHICGTCDGDGTSSAYLGSFTREDFDEDPDFAEDYMRGGYDRPCPTCGGTGKVAEVEVRKCFAFPLRQALRHMRNEARWKREAFLEHKHESLMLGESSLRDWDGVTG